MTIGRESWPIGSSLTVGQKNLNVRSRKLSSDEFTPRSSADELPLRQALAAQVGVRGAFVPSSYSSVGAGEDSDVSEKA